MALCLIPQNLCYIDVMCYVIICTKEQNKKTQKIGKNWPTRSTFFRKIGLKLPKVIATIQKACNSKK